ncbi:MAG: N-acetylmuramoyl-L-alanine amidase [Candidatus Hydrogenedentes bacterium]|nr:N-acetylmuramoyl-L-alanine amidase [Candidatus Hydrogenedentota bacterium]
MALGNNIHKPRLRAVVIACLVLCGARIAGADVVRVPVDKGATAALQDGRLLFLECRPPRGDSGAYFFERYLSDPRQWAGFKNRQAVAVPFDLLKPEVQRQMLLLVFRADYVDDQGWWHTVAYSGKQGQETLWSLCEWTTGNGLNYKRILAAQKHIEGPALEQGQRVLIPRDLLKNVMKRVTARAPLPPPRPVPSAPALPAVRPLPAPPASPAVATAPRPALPDDNGLEPVDLEAVTRKLVYGEDARGPYAIYRLKPGEALYTAVVVRFTDFRDNDLIQQACRTVQARSGITDVRNMPTGQRVLIPLEMLADRFRPQGSEQREEYEKGIEEARRLRREQVQTKDLEGVVVVIDPGHGGLDQGGANRRFGLYEDELNYDVACRVKLLLETQTQARVYVTLLDTSQKYQPTDRGRFPHDTDEKVLTTPPYQNQDAKISANLRWYLANSYLRDELKNGADPRKTVFTSFHTDALYNPDLRGAMVYIPGARYRRENELPEGAIYARFAECVQQREASSTAAERRRDEALSRNFAEDLMRALGKKHIRRHLEGDWIRTQIRQNGGVVYLPAVLRNTQIPTKILVEMANITNTTDCERLADPQWRQSFAEAYVDALKTYFGS